MNSQELARKFYQLPIPKQWEVIQKLGYLRLKDTQDSTAKFFVAVFSAAKKDSKLEELQRLVEVA